MIVIADLFFRRRPFQWVFASALSKIDIDLVVSDGPAASPSPILALTWFSPCTAAG